METLHLELINLSKHYNSSWLFKNINCTVKTNDILIITGENGSGKSTLLQIIYGLISPNDGQVLLNGKTIDTPDQIFAYSSPYLELPIDFSCLELFEFYKKLGKINYSEKEFVNVLNLNQSHLNKPIKYFSSGMLQRLKNSLVFCSSQPILIFDEPLSNMDLSGENWYKNCILQFKTNKLIIIAGNNPKEIESGTIELKIK